MSVRMFLIAAAALVPLPFATAQVVGLETLQARPDGVDVARASQIMETACEPRGIVILPVDNEGESGEVRYAILDADDLQPDSALIVSEREKDWIEQSACPNVIDDEVQDSGTTSLLS